MVSVRYVHGVQDKVHNFVFRISLVISAILKQMWYDQWSLLLTWININPSKDK